MMKTKKTKSSTVIHLLRATATRIAIPNLILTASNVIQKAQLAKLSVNAQKTPMALNPNTVTYALIQMM